MTNQRAGKRNRQTGFTLIELMIVIAIIGILAAIVTPLMMRARFSAYHTACVQNERNLATALELYALENKQLFPNDLSELTLSSKPFIAHIEDCPSVSIDYTSTYVVAPDYKTYVLACPGAHDVQLVGVVQPDFPQVHTGVIYQYGPNN